MKVIGYHQAHDSYTSAALSPAFVPVPFTLRRDDRFFVMGSCLARQIEKLLRMRGIDTLSTPPAMPQSEMLVGVTAVDRYMLPVIEQELNWALDSAEFPVDSLIEMPRGLCVDLQLPPSRSVNRDRALQRRVELNHYYERVREASVFVLDICAAEGYFDRDTGLVLNAMPPDWYAKRFPDRFEYQIWDYEDCVAALRSLCTRLLDLGPGRRIVLTLNTLPANPALSPSDVTRTTVRNRSLWIAAIDRITTELSNVAYYPLFEALTWPNGNESFDENNHPRDDVMDRIIAAMLHAFGLYIDVSPKYDPDDPAQIEPEEEVDLATLGAHVTAVIPDRVPSLRRFAVDIEVRNTGSAIYESAGRHPVSVCYRWYDANGELKEIGKSVHTSLPDPLQPGDSVTVRAVIATPVVAGSYTLALTLVKHDVAWFDDLNEANGQRSNVLVEAWDADLPEVYS